ncbi:MAG: organic solvent tolerance protein OstA [Hyphomicrobiales bacterium]|uniref:LptA/OstA family protein n=1 Tax=Rhabdaerophilum calidifontis TaxID=2604328 RepID=UPI00197E4C4D|nr:LptA/OstA family protein [Rhabdaerophilum calidifontis]MCA1999123.1 organic solvent tolerance protein OstA [Hyphomicrobiales bacterium]
MARAVLLAAGILAVPACGWAQGAAAPRPPTPAPAAKGKASGTPFAGFGSNSKEPIKVDANKLEVFDKENRGVFSGDVVAVQGQTTVRCSVMTVFYVQSRQAAGSAAPAATPAAAPAAGQSSIRRIECQGPVSIVSGTQSATSNFMVYDAETDTVTLTGQAVIADCDNVQRGERVVYDVKTGRATVDAGAKGRVQGIFVQGSDDKKKTPGECPQRK